LADLQVEIVNYFAPSIRFTELDGLELEHATSFLDRVKCHGFHTIRRIYNNPIISKIEGQFTPGRGVAS
jgi:hypothetical protein